MLRDRRKGIAGKESDDLFPMGQTTGAHGPDTGLNTPRERGTTVGRTEGETSRKPHERKKPRPGTG